KTTSYKRWLERLAEYAHSQKAKDEAPYWRRQREASRTATRLPLDWPEGENRQASANTVMAELSIEQTRRLLREAGNGYPKHVKEMLLATLARTVQLWAGGNRIAITLEGHGREDLFAGEDVSRTVGWFTTFYPVLLDVSEDMTVGEYLKIVKEQMRAVPQ